MVSKKKTREEARLPLPALTELIEARQNDLLELAKIRDAKLRVMLRAMKKGAHIHARDLVKEPEKLRHVIHYHPTSEGITWAGWGRVPQWILEALLAGATLRDLAVPKYVKPKATARPRKPQLTTTAMLDDAYAEILRTAKVKPPQRA